MRCVVFCISKGYGATGPAHLGGLAISSIGRATAFGAVGYMFQSMYRTNYINAKTGPVLGESGLIQDTSVNLV